MNKKVLANRYEIIEKIGEGGMARVYKAEDRLLNRFVAIKVLKMEFRDDDDFIGKFKKEAKAAASLSHPNIVNVYDVGQDDGIRFIVMELVEGITLDRIITKNSKSFLNNNDIIDIAFQIASALEHAHANNIIHRDIKPENIIVNEQKMVKVADFGIARAATSTTIVNTRKALGSVHYSSPEQVRGGFIDYRTDIYSLGILIYELSTNRLPFNGENQVSIAMKHINDEVVKPSGINEELSSGLEKIILKSICKNPEDRYESANELLSDLEKASRRLDHEIEMNEYDSVEDKKTKFLPNLEGDSIMGLKKFKKKKTKSKGKLSKSNENHPSKFMILVVVLSALIVSLLFFSIIYLDKFKNSIDGKIISVPNVEGLEADKAVKKLESSGFSVDYSNEKYSDKVKKGHVLSQTNKEGEELKEGYTIGIVISKGAELVKVPNVVHEEYVSGKLILENKSLVLGEVEYEYSDLPKDTIIEQIPKADTEVNQNTKINLVISEGSKNNYVLMPSLKSLTVEEARNRLSKINLKLGSVTYNPSLEFEDGEIHWQSVKNGSDISEGNTINVVVTRNNNSENNDSEDVVSDDDEDPDLISKPFIIPLDFDEESKVIKVEKVQDGTSKIVYQKEHSKSEGSVRVMVKAKGEVTIKFYYGDELISQQNKNFE